MNKKLTNKMKLEDECWGFHTLVCIFCAAGTLLSEVFMARLDVISAEGGGGGGLTSVLPDI